MRPRSEAFVVANPLLVAALRRVFCEHTASAKRWGHTCATREDLSLIDAWVRSWTDRMTISGPLSTAQALVPLDDEDGGLRAD